MPNPREGWFFCIACNRVLPEDQKDHLMKSGFNQINDSDYRLGICRSCQTESIEELDNFVR